MPAPRIVLDFVTAEPFRPLRVSKFEVGHPELIRVGRSSVTVPLRPEGDSDPSERRQRFSMMLPESIEPLEAAARRTSD